MTTNTKGDIGELAAMKQLLKNGYWCSIPFGDDCPYDILADNGKIIKRVQVKYVTPINGTLRIPFFNNSKRTRSYRNSVDWILIYDSINENCYLIDLDNFKSENETLFLRINPTKNNQSKNVLFAEQFKMK